MNFYCIGTSHHSAALETREQLNFTAETLTTALEYFQQNKNRFLGPDSELVILSTCNRLELYMAVNPLSPAGPDSQQIYAALFQYLHEVKDIRPAHMEPLFFRCEGLEAVRHLFRVAAGLESMVIGEPQILGQVVKAHEMAHQHGTARRGLAALFHAAIHAGKRARTETAVGRNPSSLSSLAAHLAEQIAGPLEGKAALVIGAGEMSYLTAKALRFRGAGAITILNRTYQHAVELAGQFDGHARPFEDLPGALAEADIAITSTGSPQPIVRPSLVQQVMQARPERPLVLLDIAMPRDVEPGVRVVPGVHLYDLDDLQQYLQESLDLRQREAGQVQVIVEQEVADFAHWMCMIPVVGKLHRKAESIRQQEVERALQHLPALDPELDAQLRAQLEILSRSLVKKLLHEPTQKLRDEAKNGQLNDHMETLKFLFGLDEDGSKHPPL